MTKTFALVAALAAAGAIALPAAGQSHAQVAVQVYASEFKFRVPLSNVVHGTITFMVFNKGKLAHDFKIAGKKTRLIRPGRSAVVKVTLRPGRYRYVCTVPGHAAAGMRGVFTVH